MVRSICFLHLDTEDVCHANTGLSYVLFSLQQIPFLPSHPLTAQQTAAHYLRLMHPFYIIFSLPPAHQAVRKYPFLFFLIFYFLFVDRGEEKEGEKHQCVPASHIPHWGPSLQPGHVP